MFDPYHKWLGIPKDQRPPTYYQLLGVASGESDPEVIEEAAVRQTTHVRAYQVGPHAAECTRILNEIAQARQTLLSPSKRKAYDEKLARRTKHAQSDVAVTAQPPAARNVFDELSAEETASQILPDLRDHRYIRKNGAAWIVPVVIGGVVSVLVLGGLVLFLLLRQQAVPPAAPMVQGPKLPPVMNPPVELEPPVPNNPPNNPELNNPPPVVPQPAPMPAPNPPQPLPAEPVAFEVKRIGAGGGIVSLIPTREPNKVIAGGTRAAVWDLGIGAGGAILGAAQPNLQVPVGAALAPDGASAFTVRMGENVAEWDLATGKQRRLLPVRAGAPQAAVSPDGKVLVFVRDDGLLSVWDLEKNGEQGTIDPKLAPDRHPPLVCMAISPDSKLLFTGHRSGAFLWDLTTRTLIGVHDNFEVFGADYHPGGELVVAVPWQLFVYDDKLNSKRATASRFAQIKFTTDGKHLVALEGAPRRQLSVLTWPLLKKARVYPGQYDAFAVSADDRAVIAHARGMLVRLALPEPQVAVAPAPPEVKPEVKSKPPEPPRDARRPPPTDAEREVAEKLMRERFAKDFAKTLPADRVLLAEKLVKLADESKESPADRFVLLNEVVNQASLGVKASLAVRTIEELAREYEIDPLKLKLTALTAIAKNANSKTASRELGDAALAAAREAALAEDFAVAMQFVGVAKAAAPKVVSVSFTNLVQKQEAVVQETAKEWERAQTAQASLKDNPEDAAANLALGKYLALRKGDWDKGLPLLAKGGDDSLAALAREDLKNPSEVKAQADLADSWYTAANKESEATKPVLQHRALYWYRQALPQATALLQTKINERIKQLEEVPAPFNPASKDRLTEVRRTNKAHASLVTALELTPDGKKLYSGGPDGFIRGWDTANGKLLSTWPAGLGVQSFALSPDLNHLAVCSESRIKIFDLRKPTARPRDMGSVPGAFFRDNDIVFRVEDITFWSHDLQTGGGSGNRIPSANVFRTVASPDRSLMVALGKSDVALARVGQRLFAGVPAIFRSQEAVMAAFSADNRLLALADKDGTITIYDVTSKQELKKLTGHNGAARSLAFASSKRLLSGGDDKSIRVWDVDAGKEIARAVHNGAVTALAVGPDVRRAYSGSADTSIREWELPTEKTSSSP